MQIKIPDDLKILTIDNKENKKFLAKKTEVFDFKKFKPSDITKLINTMKKIMKKAGGIGLSANQIGLPYQIFIAEIPEKNGNKLYAVFNPKIEKLGGEKINLEEGCLSVPKTYGLVPRYEKITITGFNRYGKPIRIKAQGLLAHIFQHEIDHLNGKLFTEKAKKIFRPEDLTQKNE